MWLSPDARPSSLTSCWTLFGGKVLCWWAISDKYEQREGGALPQAFCSLYSYHLVMICCAQLTFLWLSLNISYLHKTSLRNVQKAMYNSYIKQTEQTGLLSSEHSVLPCVSATYIQVWPQSTLYSLYHKTSLLFHGNMDPENIIQTTIQWILNYVICHKHNI